MTDASHKPERESGKRLQPKTAVALRYEKERDAAPHVVATGRGTIAEAILRRAEETGVAVREDEALTAALALLDVGDTIPPELYRAVAEVLAYIYRLDATP
jgi:flagellar biosynthesis protein